ncbi:hypothetical protein V495_02060 [Pseudogymnoascus sp. VKM F-4514 (FW-929)]|nr:hypothetical protein V495_02060 [Pseudogymnoascus sp. VKM F-4514 (FW-929)]KFY61059.1 hypothetical protein V497_03185 [Pseudogymnoascus sp. VKM F-4516 (FW-969)]
MEPVLGFWRMSCSVAQMGRVVSFDPIYTEQSAEILMINQDPVISFGHFGSCTVHKLSNSRSAYWNPQLYYLHANGKYEEVYNGGMAVYYLGRGMGAAGGTKASPFPKGIKFLSGNNNARSYDANTMTYGNATYPNVPVANRVTFACIDYNNPKPQANYMSDANCPDGMRAQIDFQSCWDGVNLYNADQSHVAYLSQIDNGICPPTHPILLPNVFIEVLYSTGDINQDGGKFVFANGDETGYSFHGDFINGWDIPTLTSAIDDCLVGVESGVVEECPAFVPSDDTNFAVTCPETSPVYSCEPVHGMIDKLPGCITPTGFDHVEQPSDNTCPGGNVASCSPNFLNAPPLPFPGSAQYKSLGCYTEAIDARALTGNSYSSTTAMTAEACIAFCAGSKYVGVEYASECYCGSTLSSGSAPAPSGDCALTCPGNRWEVCGGSSRLNLYQLN